MIVQATKSTQSFLTFDLLDMGPQQLLPKRRIREHSSFRLCERIMAITATEAPCQRKQNYHPWDEILDDTEEDQVALKIILINKHCILHFTPWRLSRYLSPFHKNRQLYTGVYAVRPNKR
jgi:hypothetical protein